MRRAVTAVSSRSTVQVTTDNAQVESTILQLQAQAADEAGGSRGLKATKLGNTAQAAPCHPGAT
ncbi:hypothetical protein C5167_040401 [Papaver somniferum]|uniref:Uncharacterized protein n=1 Tax=Papaver somniferum TaxID=3469 RepID=A0A4Y7IIA9_PAPSO|nr:hypothetical protein C5167_040401 [Papaver somniferum]